MSLEKEISELIANEVGWFNGWKASEEMFEKSVRKAARKVIKRLTKRPPDGLQHGQMFNPYIDKHQTPQVTQSVRK